MPHDTAHDQHLSLPLAGLRILDLCSGIGGSATRFLADLGADVLLVEPRVGTPAGCHDVVVDHTSVTDAVRRANKRTMSLDLDDAGKDLDVFWSLAANVDMVFEDSLPASHPSCPVSPARLRQRLPGLIVLSVTDFGQSGPYRDWVSTEAVHLALSSALARSGLPGLPPLLPPGAIGLESAAMQAAWVALVSYIRLLDTGEGEHVDFSVYEAIIQTLDPGWGIGGSATGGKPASEGPRGRPDARHLYPVFQCADGYVRICILAARQWRGMLNWLGDPEEFADPGLASLVKRFANAGRIYGAIGDLFSGLTRAEIVELGQLHGVPTAAVLSPTEVVGARHFLDRDAFITMEISGRDARVPNGLVELDGVRAGIRSMEPTEPNGCPAAVETHLQNQTARLHLVDRDSTSGSGLPLDGIRVLDLGVIVVGAETGRLFADMGAEVIKVENNAFPDGSRQSLTGDAMTWSFAWGHRNKIGVGLNLRSDRGIEIFKELVATADVVLSNFKPGTMESLGIGFDVLSQINPGLIMADSSAFGTYGPWSKRMGYGPLVRAETGLSGLWRYPDADNSFSDASTIYPDHTAGRVGAAAVLSMLIRRRVSGRGGTVSVAQAEVILGHMSALLARESIEPGTMVAQGNDLAGDAPRGVFPCAGDDDWVVVDIRDDRDFRRLAQVLGRPDWVTDARYASATVRMQHRDELDRGLSEWTSSWSPREAAGMLQAVQIPAGMMQRVTDLPTDPHLCGRGFFRSMKHPLMTGTAPAEKMPAVFENLPEYDIQPAPLAGQHSRETLARVLSYPDHLIEELIRAGVVEEQVVTGAETPTV